MRLWPFLMAGAMALTPVSALAASDTAAAAKAVDYARRGIGFTAGATSGVGFAWRDIMSNGLGYSVGAGVWVENFKDASVRWATGVQGIKVLHQTDWWRLYALVGLQSYGYPTYLPPTVTPAVTPEPVQGKPEVPPEVAMPVRVTESILNIGGGIGLELGGPPGVTVAFELPVVLGYSFGPTPGLKHLLPFPNLMVLYNF